MTANKRDTKNRLDPDRLHAMVQLLNKRGNSVPSCIVGSSMGSSLPSGAEIFIQPRPVETIRRGQVVAYLRGTGLVAHRVVFNGLGYLVTLGDALLCCDVPFEESRVLGVIESYVFDGRDFSIPEPSGRGHWHRMINGISEVVTISLLRIDARLSKTISAGLLRLDGKIQTMRGLR
jgi:hypothetical protein